MRLVSFPPRRFSGSGRPSEKLTNGTAYKRHRLRCFIRSLPSFHKLPSYSTSRYEDGKLSRKENWRRSANSEFRTATHPDLLVFSSSVCGFFLVCQMPFACPLFSFYLRRTDYGVWVSDLLFFFFFGSNSRQRFQGSLTPSDALFLLWRYVVKHFFKPANRQRVTWYIQMKSWRTPSWSPRHRPEILPATKAQQQAWGRAVHCYDLRVAENQLR